MDLENCTLVELRQIAKERGIKNTSKLKKEELIQELANLEGNIEVTSEVIKAETIESSDTLRSDYSSANIDNEGRI